jgi:hypothetical protein
VPGGTGPAARPSQPAELPAADPAPTARAAGRFARAAAELVRRRLPVRKRRVTLERGSKFTWRFIGPSLHDVTLRATPSASPRPPSRPGGSASASPCRERTCSSARCTPPDDAGHRRALKSALRPADKARHDDALARARLPALLDHADARAARACAGPAADLRPLRPPIRAAGARRTRLHLQPIAQRRSRARAAGGR